MSLPPNWTEYRTPEGVSYFYNSASKVTQWDRPSFPAGLSQPPSKPAPSPNKTSSSSLSSGKGGGGDAPLPQRADLMSAIKGGAKLKKVTEGPKEGGGGGGGASSKGPSQGAPKGGGGGGDFASSLQAAVAARKKVLAAPSDQGSRGGSEEGEISSPGSAAIGLKKAPIHSHSPPVPLLSTVQGRLQRVNIGSESSKTLTVEDRLERIEAKLNLIIQHLNIKE